MIVIKHKLMRPPSAHWIKQTHKKANLRTLDMVQRNLLNAGSSEEVRDAGSFRPVPFDQGITENTAPAISPCGDDRRPPKSTQGVVRVPRAHLIHDAKPFSIAIS